MFEELFRPFFPRFLLEKLVEQPAEKLAGRPATSRGATLFVDVSGFTPLSERLATLGREGAEQLTRTLNGFFEKIIEPIDDVGGDVMAFAGDAMSVFISAGDDLALAARTAAIVALRIQEAARPFEKIETPAGPASLRVKIGLAAGLCRIGIVGEPDVGFRTFFAGDPVDAAAAAEHHCRPGDVFADESARVGGVEFVRDGLVSGVSGETLPRRPSGISHGQAPAADRLEPFLPSALARRLRETGDGGISEHRNTAVAFLKFLGIEPEDPDADERIQSFFVAASRIVEGLGGTVNKIDTGDKGSKLLVLFGAPVAHEDDSRRAAMAALELVEAGCAQSRPLDVRIGLHAGRIFSGIVGSRGRREYTAMGDAVNIAARLMERARPNEVVVTRDFALPLTRLFRFGSFEPVQFKGKAEPISVAPLVGASEGGGASLELEPIVGREDEVRRVRGWLEGDGSHGGILFVDGAPGVGKSSFVRAVLSERLDSNRWIVRGDGSEHRQREIYALWKRPVRAVIEALGGKGDARNVVRKADSELERWFGLLGEFFGSELAEELPESADPEIRRSLLWRILTILFSEAGRAAPLVVILENLQWADPLSLELARHLTAEPAPSPTWVLVGRDDLSDFSRGVSELPSLRIEIPPLGRSAIESLLRKDSGAREIPRELTERLWWIASGNPLFTLELLKSLFEAKVVERDPDDSGMLWYSPLKATELPGSLEGLFLSRFDRLPPAQQDFLRRAAVFGDRIPVDLFDELLSGVAARTGGLEELLSGQEFLERDDEDLAFRRSLEREVVYQSIDFASRRELHGSIGTVLERRLAENDPTRNLVLSHHFFHSGDRRRAVPYLSLAGERARRAFSNTIASEHYERLLIVCLDQPDSELRTLQNDARLALAEILMNLGEIAAAKKHAEALRDSDDATPGLRTHAFYLIAELHRLAGELDAARGGFLEAEIAAGATKRDDIAFWARTAIGRIEAQQGNLAGAKEILEKALAVHPRQRSTAMGLLAQMNVAMIMGYTGSWEVALKRLGSVAFSAARRGELGIQFKSLGNISTFALFNNSDRLCRAKSLAAIRLGERCGFVLNLSSIVSNMGLVELRRGRMSAAEGYFDRALSLDRRLKSPDRASRLSNLGFTAYLRGDYGAALDRLRKARELAVEVSRSDFIGPVWIDLVWAAYELGDEALFGELSPLFEQESLLRRDDPIRLFVDAFLRASARKLRVADLEDVAKAAGALESPREEVLFRILASRVASAFGELEIAEEHRRLAARAAAGVPDRFLEARVVLLESESKDPSSNPSQEVTERIVSRRMFPDICWRLERAQARRDERRGDAASARRRLARAQRQAVRLSKSGSNPELAAVWKRRLARFFPGTPAG